MPASPLTRTLLAMAIAAVASTAAAVDQPPVATIGLTAGTATFGQVFVPGAVVGSVAVGTLPTQTDVKVRWPDGSIRFAVISAVVPTTGTYPLTGRATSTAAAFVPRVPDMAVRLVFAPGGPFTGTWTAPLPASPTSDVWLDGAVAHEWRAIVSPIGGSDAGAQAGESHPFLRVIYDVRAYADGTARVSVEVDDVLDILGASDVAYAVDILASGTSQYHHDTFTHFYYTNWHRTVDIGGLDASEVTPDYQQLILSGALPAYQVWSGVQNPPGYAYPGGTFDLMSPGCLDPYMGDVGGRPEIGPYPSFVAGAVTDGSVQGRRYVLAMGDVSGSWPMHIAQPDGSMISIDARPQFWFDGRGSDRPVNLSPTGFLTSGSPLAPDVAHQPSLAYVPYLLTGDRYDADELRAWANYELIDAWPAPEARNGADGLLIGNAQVRAMAWGLRTLVDAAAYLPDADPTKAYFISKVANNLAWFDAFVPSHPTPLGTFFDSTTTVGGTNVVQFSTWQDNFLAWSLQHAHDQGFPGGTTLRDAMLAFDTTIFQMPDVFDAPQFAGSLYYPIIGTVNTDGSWALFTDWRTFFLSNGLPPAANNPGAQSLIGGEYADAMLIGLAAAVDAGVSGADAAYDTYRQTCTPDLNWAIEPRTRLAGASTGTGATGTTGTGTSSTGTGGSAGGTGASAAGTAANSGRGCGLGGLAGALLLALGVHRRRMLAGRR